MKRTIGHRASKTASDNADRRYRAFGQRSRRGSRAIVYIIPFKSMYYVYLAEEIQPLGVFGFVSFFWSPHPRCCGAHCPVLLAHGLVPETQGCVRSPWSRTTRVTPPPPQSSFSRHAAGGLPLLFGTVAPLCSVAEVRQADPGPTGSGASGSGAWWDPSHVSAGPP